MATTPSTSQSPSTPAHFKNQVISMTVSFCTQCDHHSLLLLTVCTFADRDTLHTHPSSLLHLEQHLILLSRYKHKLRDMFGSDSTYRRLVSMPILRHYRRPLQCIHFLLPLAQMNSKEIENKTELKIGDYVVLHGTGIDATLA